MKLSLTKTAIEEILAPVNDGNATSESLDAAQVKLVELRNDENAAVVDAALERINVLRAGLTTDTEPSSSEEYYESSSSY